MMEDAPDPITCPSGVSYRVNFMPHMGPGSLFIMY